MCHCTCSGHAQHLCAQARRCVVLQLHSHALVTAIRRSRMQEMHRQRQPWCIMHPSLCLWLFFDCVPPLSFVRLAALPQLFPLLRVPLLHLQICWCAVCCRYSPGRHCSGGTGASRRGACRACTSRASGTPACVTGSCRGTACKTGLLIEPD
jgi:hypothetical protein